MYAKIIAICGMPGSGKGEISKLANQKGIPVLSMGDMIRAEAERRGLEETPGNIGLVVVSLRSQFGEQILADRLVPSVEALSHTSAEIIFIEGIRGTAEVEVFKQKWGNNFSLLGILSDEDVSNHISRVAKQRKQIEDYISNNTEIIDRLAVCRLDNSGFHSNGYLVTAWAGDRADACCIIHGYQDGSLEDPRKPPLSASFYANSFLENGQDRYDLSRMATALDPSGGGHVNACGCRIQHPGLKSNLEHWLEMWTNRESILALSKD